MSNQLSDFSRLYSTQHIEWEEVEVPARPKFHGVDVTTGNSDAVWLAWDIALRELEAKTPDGRAYALAQL